MKKDSVGSTVTSAIMVLSRQILMKKNVFNYSLIWSIKSSCHFHSHHVRMKQWWQTQEQSAVAIPLFIKLKRKQFKNMLKEIYIGTRQQCSFWSQMVQKICNFTCFTHFLSKPAIFITFTAFAAEWHSCYVLCPSFLSFSHQIFFVHISFNWVK